VIRLKEIRVGDDIVAVIEDGQLTLKVALTWEEDFGEISLKLPKPLSESMIKVLDRDEAAFFDIVNTVIATVRSVGDVSLSVIAILARHQRAEISDNN
jgi:hypothetical protein